MLFLYSIGFGANLYGFCSNVSSKIRNELTKHNYRQLNFPKKSYLFWLSVDQFYPPANYSFQIN